MTAAKAPRGRPKGSGINDQQQLNEIARLMRSTPRMKPTTAIKALGITDPSTIRRLRDKFNARAPGSTKHVGRLRTDRQRLSDRTARGGAEVL